MSYLYQCEEKTDYALIFASNGGRFEEAGSLMTVGLPYYINSQKVYLKADIALDNYCFLRKAAFNNRLDMFEWVLTEPLMKNFQDKVAAKSNILDDPLNLCFWGHTDLFKYITNHLVGLGEKLENHLESNFFWKSVQAGNVEFVDYLLSPQFSELNFHENINNAFSSLLSGKDQFEFEMIDYFLKDPKHKDLALLSNLASTDTDKIYTILNRKIELGKYLILEHNLDKIVMDMDGPVKLKEDCQYLLGHSEYKEVIEQAKTKRAINAEKSLLIASLPVSPEESPEAGRKTHKI